ncbi:MAG: molybdenum cofactor biosynthesis protein MoaA [Hyphomicrobiales bacterium]|nr:molybdenum cofactor biosynthesis protein MoaA [Hyphomicrobiales bacterium]
MSGAPLLPVSQALERVLASAPSPLPAEHISLTQARGRTLAEDVAALRTQPPFPASAMDGYAVRASDIAQVPASLHVIGTSAAGHRFAGAVGAGQAVRIFTGAPVPDGADTILIQENTRAEGDAVIALESEEAGRYVRRAGLDFTHGEVLLARGRRLGPPELALAAAMNHPTLPVTRRPRVALLATGDELVRPGESLGPDQIVASNTYAVAAYAEAAGAEVIDLGIAGDRFSDLEASIRAAREAGADVLVTLGGASVGDHDLVQTALSREGMELGFWRIAMRPGKPLMHGRIGDMRILGLPGNPVSAIVCGVLFLVPLVRALSGDPKAGEDRSEIAVLGLDLPANDSRQDYLRAHIAGMRDGHPLVEAFSRQDSSMLRVLAEAECLIVRDAHAPPAKAGEACRIVRL